MIDTLPDLWRVSVSEPKRSDEQNDAMWWMIDQIKKQPPDWFDKTLDKDEIKQVMMGGLFKEMKMVRNADNDGYMPIAYRSSRLSWREMGELLSYIEAWCARNGIEMRRETT